MTKTNSLVINRIERLQKEKQELQILSMPSQIESQQGHLF